MKKKKFAAIIGAGPAGLTAAYELVKRTKIEPVIFESSSEFGGISRTVNYKGNRIDIGGHRFFSKSTRVMDWWEEIMPIQGRPSKDDLILNRELNLPDSSIDPNKEDIVFLIRKRISRIFFLRKFFDYPISLKFKTFSNLGLVKVLRIGISYLWVQIFKRKDEKNLEDFLVNRFGYELYALFFRDYTEKVWGVSCDKIKAEWGAQRIKGLSISKAVYHALKKILFNSNSIYQKDIETSLISQFLYPKYGPGQLWERVVEILTNKSVKIYKNFEVNSILINKEEKYRIASKDNDFLDIEFDYVFSTMPIKELIPSIRPLPPRDVLNIAENLEYRDFITVGLLLSNMDIKNDTNTPSIDNIIPDNWVYIQERDVKLGRLQIFNNWSPYMVNGEKNIWIGLEYFCNEGDELWSMIDKDFIDFAVSELISLQIIREEYVLDSTIVRQKKAYPAYFGSYDQIDTVKQYTNSFKNLFLIGRNGMHKYNNSDHSMLTAMTAVDNILNGVESKDNLWKVNTEEDYHESK